MNRPVFSPALDADPAVKAWLDSLPAKVKALLRDDVTPLFKEVAHEGEFFARKAANDDEEPEAPRLSEEVLDAMRTTSQSELFPELGEDLRGAIMKAARANLSDYQYRAFAAWFRGTNRNRVARLLGVSRSTVRCALDGEGRRGGPGAIAVFMEAIQRDDNFRKVVMDVATKQINKQERATRDRSLRWYKGCDNKPDLVPALAMLMVLDDLADARREVKISEVLPHFPRNLITPCMRLLKAFGYASSDGHVIKIHQLPTEKETAS